MGEKKLMWKCGKQIRQKSQKQLFVNRLLIKKNKLRLLFHGGSMNRFQTLLEKQNEYLRTFIEARKGLEDVQEQLRDEQMKSAGIIEERENEIALEREAIREAESHYKVLTKKIKVLNKIVG